MTFRNKLLSVLAPVAAMAAVVPMALTSCNQNTPTVTNSASFSGSKKITKSGTDKTISLEFTLANEIGSRETLRASIQIVKSSNIAVTIKDTKPTASGKTVPVTLSISGTESGTASFNIEIYALDSLMEQVWSSKIEGFEVTYTK